MRVLVVLGHPRPASLCGALAAAVAAGARRAGADVRTLDVARMRFDPDVHAASPNAQFQEEDVRHARELVSWAEHLVFVYPNWWGTMPALLKGFLDRVFTPGFAFAERDGRYEPLLRGRTADLITTMDMPRWVYRWIFAQPGNRAMARAVLGFCGVRAVRILNFGPVNRSRPAQRGVWIARAERVGERLAGGAFSRRQRLTGTALNWLRALRLQFYPTTWMAYTLGVLAATGGSPLAWPGYWAGLFTLVFLEAATVFSNEVEDFETDRRNLHYGPFNGGSRVLVEGRLSSGALKTGAWLAAFAVPPLALVAALSTAAPSLSVAVLIALAILALGYTLPPLRLVYRGAGEVTVAATHSVCVVLFGYALGGGSVADPEPWLLSLPMLLAVLPSITLAGVADESADRSVGKRTLAVLLGRDRAAAFAAVAAIAAAVAAGAASVWWPGLYGWWGLAMVPHAALLGALVTRYRRAGAPAGRVDGLLVCALSYLLWFVVLPLLALT
jgi:putative NADPH-quinone reductase/1,4-dihydroxy-2-naphthoate octaprenyltransferase